MTMVVDSNGRQKPNATSATTTTLALSVIDLQPDPPRADPFEIVEYESWMFRITGLLFVAGLAWYAWPGISALVNALGPKRPHPGLHAFLGASRIATVLLVWCPLGALLAFMAAALVGFYVVSAAILLGTRTSCGEILARIRC
jgi:hypothetical protein